MIEKRHIVAGIVLSAGLVGLSLGNSNIDDTNKYAWGENVGFLNFRDANAGQDGVQVMNGFLQGYIWGENIGWINTGNGSGPYANTDNTNFGVNIDVNGNLTGYAWAENVGWINFAGGAMATPAQPARIDLANMRFRGYAWGENIGWINLDDGNVFVGFDSMMNACLGDFDNDGDVDLGDFGFFGSAFGSVMGDPNYQASADFDNDGDVDLGDFGAFGTEFGRTDCLN
ncbi:MAG: hypothetical protein Tsb0013_21560 [Phycisphaerales bacterium]